MIVLGIESSCDETAVALVKDGVTVMSNIVSSQIKKHAKYGGVVPELAAREHIKNIDYVVNTSLEEADKTLDDIDIIAVTQKPGLMPSLLVGVSFANGLALKINKPLVAVNHLEGHLYSVFLEKRADLQRNFPAIGLLVSGGHTQLFYMKTFDEVELLGTTLDDACGEAFDKAAKLLNLPYPGGPVIDKLAKQGNKSFYHFPRPLTGESGKKVEPKNIYNFSFSGLKTSLFYYLKNNILKEKNKVDIIASFQEAIIDVLIKKTTLACKNYACNNIIIAGGVACNTRLREAFKQLNEQHSYSLFIPLPSLCTDNAAMIAGLAYHQRKRSINNVFLDPKARI